jgi:hypothetical protein
MPSSGREAGGLHLARPLGGYDRARNLPPDLESFDQCLAVLGSGEPVASQSEVLGDGTIRGEKALGVPWPPNSLHTPLPLARRLVGAFGAVGKIAVLAMFYTSDSEAARWDESLASLQCLSARARARW